MAYTNSETSKLLNKRIVEFEDSINLMEKGMNKKGDEFDKSLIAFQFGRMQSIYIQVAELLKNLKVI